MRFILKNKTGENLNIIMRRLGYHYLGLQAETSEASFIRPLGQSAYPRFHIYLKPAKGNETISFSIHLDQKRPVYKGQTAHSGEYDSELVREEAERIKSNFGEQSHI